MENLPLNEIFTSYTISVYFNNYVETRGKEPYLGTGLFPKVKTSKNTMKQIKGSRGLPVSLTPSNYDALATLRNRIGFKELEHDMPFFRESYLIKEKDAQDYENYMNANDSSIARSVLNQIMLGPVDLIDGANVVPERMIWQLLMPIDGSPKISINSNGVAYDYNYDVLGEYKKNNFLEITTAADKWTDKENSNPYLDLRKAKKLHKERYGIDLTAALMNEETFQLIVENKNIRSYLLTQNIVPNILVDDELVLNFIKSKLKIKIYPYDKMYRDESGASKKFAIDNMVTLLPSMSPLGQTQYGKTPEERSGSANGASLSVVDTGVSVYTFSTLHPIVNQCIVSEVVLPSYEQMDDTFVLKVA